MPDLIGLYFVQHSIHAGCVMGYVELISKLEALPREKQAEVLEFVDFLSERCGATADNTIKRAEVAAITWNSFNKRIGSFADQHSTL
ncbi:MAG: hypothetical protein HZB47_12420 [Nitrosomonadales bacterium]|nr:hypothetical protein [Nitrosomonadales bacterium]